MTIVMIGKISMPLTMCEKCGENIQLWTCPEKNVKCKRCGAFYKVIEIKYEDQCVRFECEFVEFQCIKVDAMSVPCTNVCPAQAMFCKDHVTDECFRAANTVMEYHEKLIELGKEELNRMEESKKIWLIEEISGVK
ncbi:MAG: hypothetical protein WC523_04970 [Patescibacteria group bacterium]